MNLVSPHGHANVPPQPPTSRTTGAPISEEITRKSGSNLALAFFLLPPERREAMAALYAFCRCVDDVADEDSVPVERRADELAHWREETRLACEGREPTLPVLREFQPHIHRYRLPFRLFDELITGVEMDLVTVRYADPAALERYCYHVASVVGLLSIEIFGYRDPACRQYADSLGKALQLTNILRDVGNDAQRGRIYLPQSDLERFGVRERDVLEGRETAGFRALAEVIAERARGFYAQARSQLPAVDRATMMSAELMGCVYWELLRDLERMRFPVLNPVPHRLTRARKLWIIARTVLRWKLGFAGSGYGV